MAQFASGTGVSPSPKQGGGFMGFMEKISPFIPMVGGAISNVLAGINERKARLYNSPSKQVARLNQAGLPKAAASNLQPGGGVVATSSLGTENLTGNLKTSIDTQVSRKQLQILQDEARIKKAEADLAQGNAANLLNPAGQFENTNQGVNSMQQQQQQAEAIKAAQIINKWMPQEKAQSMLKTSFEIGKISADTQNALTQHGILLNQKAIGDVIAKYQEDMSLNELKGLIRRNTGISLDNKLKKIAINVEYNIMQARITSAYNQALQSGHAAEAARLGNVLTNLSMPSTAAYYEIRRNYDNATLAKPNLPNTLLYLGMFQPNTSNYNMSNIGAGIHTGLSRWWDMTQ